MDTERTGHPKKRKRENKMKKYIIMKDYKNTSKIEYVDANSNDIFEVMKEAESLHTEEIYLTMILEKVGKQTIEDGFKVTHYTDKIEHRTAWYTTNYKYDIVRSESKKYGFVNFN